MSVIFAMIIFSLSMSISPGPVNMIALSSGVNHGFKVTMKFVSGATIGFSLLLLLIGLGFEFIPFKQKIFINTITYLGCIFIAYMGYKIVTSKFEPKIGDSSSTFLHGFLLQWSNPKAWIACLSGISAFNAGNIKTLFTFVLIYFFVCYISIAFWALVGDRLKNIMKNKIYFRMLNVILGLMLMFIALHLFLMRNGA